MDRSHVRRRLRLAFLSTRRLIAIVRGTTSGAITIDRLSADPIPLDRREQDRLTPERTA